MEQERNRRLTIIVPVYFNELNLPDTVPQRLALKPELACYDLELVFVDDGSGDRSLPILLDLQRQHPEEIRVVKLTRNFGSMAAMQAGFTVARGDCIGMISADLQDPPELFLERVRHWEQGNKAVFASRHDRDESPVQKFFANSYYALIRRFALKDYPTGGFSDAFEGRAPGTEGEKKTLAYLEQQLRAAGLQPGIGGSYLQPVPVVEITPHADAVMQLAGPDGKSLALRNPDDVVVWTKRPVPSSGVGNAEVVYAGYGIVAPEYGWDDYAGLDVRGKLVLALVNDPGYATQDARLFTGNAMTYYGRWDYKFAEAVRHGAAGMLVIHETKAAGYPWDVPRNGATKPQFDLRIDDYATRRLALEGWITEDAASRVLSAAGMDFAALKRAAPISRLQG